MLVSGLCIVFHCTALQQQYNTFNYCNSIVLTFIESVLCAKVGMGRCLFISKLRSVPNLYIHKDISFWLYKFADFSIKSSLLVFSFYFSWWILESLCQFPLNILLIVWLQFNSILNTFRLVGVWLTAFELHVSWRWRFSKLAFFVSCCAFPRFSLYKSYHFCLLRGCVIVSVISCNT